MASATFLPFVKGCLDGLWDNSSDDNKVILDRRYHAKVHHSSNQTYMYIAYRQTRFKNRPCICTPQYQASIVSPSFISRNGPSTWTIPCMVDESFQNISGEFLVPPLVDTRMPIRVYMCTCIATTIGKRWTWLLLLHASTVSRSIRVMKVAGLEINIPV